MGGKVQGPVHIVGQVRKVQTADPVSLSQGQGHGHAQGHTSGRGQMRASTSQTTSKKIACQEPEEGREVLQP